MMLIKPLTDQSDLDALLKLAKESGVGLTTLPVDRDYLANQIRRSATAFSQKRASESEQLYLFALYDTERKRIAGVSGIQAKIGLTTPNYQFKLSHVTRICKSLAINVDYQYLTLVNDFQNQSELCSLFLSPNYRYTGVGALLSRARLLYMAQHPKRFSDIVFAEMRGVCDEQGQSPFWQSLGQHFFPMSFDEADRLSVVTDRQFISDLLPRGKIYTCLLNKKTQNIIGKTHTDTKPAMKLLQKEGFAYHNYVDIFDAGPTMSCHLNNILTVRNSRVVRVAEIQKNCEGDNVMISTIAVRPLICYGSLIRKSETAVILDQVVAKALGLTVGDKIRIC